MHYTTKQAATLTNLSVYTLHYYDKEGLLPLVKRTKSGARRFSENDIEWIRLICCLKNTGMHINTIKTFLSLCLKGSKTCKERRDMMLAHKENILNQIEQLKQALCIIDYKIDHYHEIGVFHIDAK